MKRVSLLCALFLLISTTPSYARTWLVRQDGSGDCTTIQACVDLAGDGDTVLVGAGVYSEELYFGNKTDFVLKAELGVSQTVLQNVLVSPCIFCGNLFGESVIEGFTFADCHSNSGAGAIQCSNSSLIIRGNVFRGCSSAGIEGGGGAGGAICVLSCSGEISGNTIYNCLVGTGGQGGGIFLFESPSMLIDRNIIVGCTGTGVYSDDYVPPISCNDLWNNLPSNYGGIIPDQTGANGNISLDPLFCSVPAEDFSLQTGSPCLAAPGCGLIGALGEGCPPVSVEEHWTTWGRIKVLFR
ncbi:MAG: right-handed parallel beta-helix repeat-containing protein [Planctomycetota bacterium]